MTTATRHAFTPDTYPADCTHCVFPSRHEVHRVPDETTTARALMVDGSTKALNHASPTWRTAAEYELRCLAATGDAFTADDLVARVGLPRGTGQNANNALGGLFAASSRAGLIERTGDTVQSRRREGHARRITVWRGTGGARRTTYTEVTL